MSFQYFFLVFLSTHLLRIENKVGHFLSELAEMVCDDAIYFDFDVNSPSPGIYRKKLA